MERTKELRWKLMGFVGLVLMMCFVFVQSSMTALAAEGKVKVAAAKIRQDATTSSAALGSAVQGDTFTITDEVTGNDGKVWYQITFDGNKTGYIRSDLMTKTESTGGNNNQTVNPTVEVTDVQPVSATITGNVVRVRSDATTEGSTILASVVDGSVVTVTGQAKDSQDKTWYRVTFSSDSGEVTGFIREDFMEVSGAITPVENIPVTPPVTDNPPAPTEQPAAPVITDKYYVVEDNGVWYLVDKDGGYQYETKSLIEGANKNPVVIKDYQAKVKSQKACIVILIFLLVALGVGTTVLFLKLREVMDEAYFTAVEKDTIRQRQGQKANNPQGSSKPMHTVGAGGNTGNKQGAPKTSMPKAGNTRPASQGQKATGNVPQTVKVSNPAETRATKPAGTQPQRPVGTQPQRPAAEQQQRPVGEQQQRPAGTPQQKPQQRTATPQQTKTVVQNEAAQQKRTEKAWNSKNFVNDDDDEDEFEFLNWDADDDM